MKLTWKNFERVQVVKIVSIDQATQKRGFGEQIIKESLVEFDRRIEKQKDKRY